METFEVLAVFLLLLAVALLVWIATQVPSGRRDREASMTRLDARLDEQTRRSDQLSKDFSTASQAQQKAAYDLKEAFLQRQLESSKTLQETLQGGVERVQRQLADNLAGNTEDLVKRMERLTESTDTRLKEISGQVERRLAEGFEKTNKTFTNIQERLALIDDAQKKITELSTNVVSLQRVLADRTSRGAFGEVQLKALVDNVLPESAYRMQHGLSNGKRVDCMLFLPEPTGKVPIDSKFPLENYRRKADPDASDEVRRQAERDFARDVQTHIDDVASKYLIPGETSGGAILFIPAEAVFADVHAHYPELVERAQRLRVWMASPTTLMAILTTAAAVIKDSETREQVHRIQEHLQYLAKDFERFQKRMDALAQHIDLANRDVEQVNTSARKITSRFQKIERLELEPAAQGELELLDEES